jgi:GT2 family glycosyltransferase
MVDYLSVIFEGVFVDVKLIGVVIPTLGDRPEYLEESILSIRQAGDAHISIVRPEKVSAIDQVLMGKVDSIVDDPGRGLAHAINTGMRSLPTNVRYSTWLGDDDRLVQGSLQKVSHYLETNADAAFVFGQCQYIDATGQKLWLNKSGKWTEPLMLCGPQLIPQPGSLFRRSSFEQVGGLDEGLKWAFDLDLFLKLRKVGKFGFLNEPLAEFRWHDGSLSVGSRQGSVDEASKVRRRYLPVGVRQASAVWEPVLRKIILFAGQRMSKRILKN